jgi:HD-GYP domain-containing protein (c-di-GMP phosphodiesterase class II)
VSRGDLTHIRRGALLHDIGKIGVPDAILNKPGPLTDEEWVVMRRHPEVAVELLADVDFLAPALEIPCCHHEKWDGTGYPDRLRGEEIPYSARVLQVADVYDALTTDRPYRAAFDHDAALGIMQGDAGLLDPTLFAVFRDRVAPALRVQPRTAERVVAVAG